MIEWIDLLGRLHPVVLHLPIGILVLLVLLEIGSLIGKASSAERWPTLSDGTRAFILFCLGVSTIFSAAIGLMLANAGGYDEQLLFDHRMFGLIATVLVLLLFLVYRIAVLYTLMLCTTVAVMILAGHNGGSLTHGKGYLSAFLNPGSPGKTQVEAKTVSRLEEVDVFAHVVQPIFLDRCESCHGDSKQKGGLRLDSMEAVRKGGDDGAVLVAGDPDESLFLQRLWLPEEDEDHMPPEGKPQPSEEEIRLLEWWVNSGAPAEMPIAEAKLSGAMEKLVSNYLGFAVEEETPLPDREEVMAEARRLENQLGILTQSLDPREPWLEVNARLQFEAFGDDELKQLEPIAAVIRRLDLGETGVTDAGLVSLKDFINLRMLKLDRTRITDAGLTHLSPLTELRSLTLFSTAVSDAGLKALRDLPNLKSVYLLDTHVTEAGAAALKARLSNEGLVRHLEQEIQDLQKQILDQQVEVNLGESVRPDAVVPKAVEPGEN
ncbi:MAG: hypothetical protein KJT03_19060 [Verrucomicrobiae bacterium]|nr:hypothetical protein [Verrucomicrobiae bacterium]